MQKNFKRILSLILTAAMIFTMNTTAFAEPGSATEEPAAALEAAVAEGAAVEATEPAAADATEASDPAAEEDATEAVATEAAPAEAPAAETTTEAPAAETAAVETAVAETAATETPAAEAVTEEVAAVEAEETAVVEDEVEAAEGTASKEEDKELAASAVVASDYVLLNAKDGKDAASDNFAVSENKDGGYFLLIKETGDYYLAPQKDDAVKLILSVNKAGVSVSLDAAKLTAGKPLAIEVGDVVDGSLKLTSVDRELTAIYVREWYDEDGDEEYCGSMVESYRNKDSGKVGFYNNTVKAGDDDHPTMIYIGNLKDTKFPASKMHAEADEIDQREDMFDVDRLENGSVFLTDENVMAGVVVSGNTNSTFTNGGEDENKLYRARVEFGNNYGGYPSGNDLRFSTFAIALTDENKAPVSFSLLKLNAPKFEGTEKVVRKAGFVADDGVYDAYFAVEGSDNEGKSYEVYLLTEKQRKQFISDNEYSANWKATYNGSNVNNYGENGPFKNFVDHEPYEEDLYFASLDPGVTYYPAIQITTPVTQINGDGVVTVQGNTEYGLVDYSFTTPFGESDFVDKKMYGTQFREIDRKGFDVYVPLNKAYNETTLSICAISGNSKDSETYVAGLSENEAEWHKIEYNTSEGPIIFDKEQQRYRRIYQFDQVMGPGDNRYIYSFFKAKSFEDLAPGTEYALWLRLQSTDGSHTEYVKLGDKETVDDYVPHFALNRTELEYRSMNYFQSYSENPDYNTYTTKNYVTDGLLEKEKEDQTYLEVKLASGKTYGPGNEEYFEYAVRTEEPLSYSFLSGNTIVAGDIVYGKKYAADRYAYTLYDLLRAGGNDDAVVYEKNRKYTVSANWGFTGKDGKTVTAQTEFTLIPSPVTAVPFDATLKTKDHKISGNTIKFSLGRYRGLAGYDEDNEEWPFNDNDKAFTVSADSAALAAFSVDGEVLTKDKTFGVGKCKLTVEDVSKLEDLKEVKEFHKDNPGMELTNIDWTEPFAWYYDEDEVISGLYDSELETEQPSATLTVYPGKVSDFKLNPGKVMYGETGRVNSNSNDTGGTLIYNELFNPSVTAEDVSGNAMEEFDDDVIEYKFFSTSDMASDAVSNNGTKWDKTKSDKKLWEVSANDTIYLAAKFTFDEGGGNTDLTKYTTSSVKISPREVMVVMNPNPNVGFKRKQKTDNVTVSENDSAYGGFYLRWDNATVHPDDENFTKDNKNNYSYSGSFAFGDDYIDKDVFNKAGKELLTGTMTLSAGHIQDTEPGYFKAPIINAGAAVLSKVKTALGSNYELVTDGKGFVRVIPSYYLTFAANNNGENLERTIEVNYDKLEGVDTVGKYLKSIKVDAELAKDYEYPYNYVTKEYNLYQAMFEEIDDYEYVGDINENNGEFINFINKDYDYVKYWKYIDDWHVVQDEDKDLGTGEEIFELKLSMANPHDYYFTAQLKTKAADNIKIGILNDVVYDGRAHVLNKVELTKGTYMKLANDLNLQLMDEENGVPLRYGKDYTVTYKNNTNASVALDESGALKQRFKDAKRPSVIIKGKGAFNGFTFTMYFNILPRDLGENDYYDDDNYSEKAIITNLKHTYTKSTVRKAKPAVVKGFTYWENINGEGWVHTEKTLKLKEKKDYEAVLYKYDPTNKWWERQTYQPNKATDSGDYLYTIWGRGNYTGSVYDNGAPENYFHAGDYSVAKKHLLIPGHDDDGTPVYDWLENSDVFGAYAAYQFTVVADDSVDLENGKASAKKKSLPYVKDKYYGAEDFGIAMNAGSGKAKKTLTDGKEYAVRFVDEDGDLLGVDGISINAAGTYIPRIYSIKDGGYYGYIDGPKVTIKGQKLSAKDFKVTYRNNETGLYEEYKKPLPFDSRDNRIKLEITPAGQKKGLSSDSFGFWVQYKDEEDKLQDDGEYENSQPNTYEVYVNGKPAKGFEWKEGGVKIKAFKRAQMSLADAIKAGSLSINLLDAPYNIKGAYPTISMNYYGRQQKSFQPLVNNFKRTFTDNYGNTTELTFTVKNNSKVGEGKATMTIKADGALKGTANADSAGKFTYNIVPYDATYQDITEYNPDDRGYDYYGGDDDEEELVKFGGNRTDGGGSDHKWIFMEKMPWLKDGFKYGQVLAVVKDGLKAKAKKGQDAVADYSKKADVTLYQTAYQYFKDVDGKGNGGYRLVAYKLNNNQYKKAISCNVIPDAGGLYNHTNVYLNSTDKGVSGFLFKNTKTDTPYDLYDKKADIKSITVQTEQIGTRAGQPVMYTLPRYSALFAEFQGKRFRPYVLSVTLKDGTVLGPNSFDVIYGQNSSAFGNITIVLKRNEKTRDYTNGGSKTFRFVILSREAQKI